MSYRFADSFRAGPGWFCSKAVFRPVWHTPVPSLQWINFWWWAEELPEICRVSCRSKFGKLVHLVDFITKKSVKGFHTYNLNKQVEKYPAFSTHILQIPFSLILHMTEPDMHMSQIQMYYWMRPDRLWGLSNFRSNGYQDCLPRGKAARTRNKPLLSRGVMQNAWNYTYLYSPCSPYGTTGTPELS